MKSMKRLSLMLLILLMGIGAAQAQFRFGVKAGANFNKLDLESFGANFETDNGAGFTGGVMTEFQVPIVGLCFDASLMYTRMNGSIDGVQSSEAKNFFQIPINIKYKFDLPVVGNLVAPYIFTGPDFAFKLGGDDDVFKTKTFQCAWNVGIGVELINHLQIGGSYGFGINNICDEVIGINVNDNIKTHNNYWTLTAAWLF